MKTKIAIRFVTAHFKPLIRRAYAGTVNRVMSGGKIFLDESERGMRRLRQVKAR
jgi:hypothetical protein